jgi:hypothetical protein
VTARARRITDAYFNGRHHVLLVAPTQLGTYCTSVSGPYGGTSCDNGRPALDPGQTGDQSGPILFKGSFASYGATKVVMTFQDGTRSVIPFYWVSAPIRAGFFLYPVPAAQRRPGHRPTLLTVYGNGGKTLAQQHLRTTVP